jgi:MFS family permease
MGLASSAVLAAIGAGLTGLGYALVFPGLGVEAVRRAPPESQGLAMGAYTACLDLALGISGPVFGLVASRAGLAAVFLVSAAVVLTSVLIAFRLLPPRRRASDGCAWKFPSASRSTGKDGYTLPTSRSELRLLLASAEPRHARRELWRSGLELHGPD